MIFENFIENYINNCSINIKGGGKKWDIKANK